MSDSNPFGDAMDNAETDSDDATTHEFDVERYYDELGEGPKDKTVGIAVDEPTRRFYQELANDPDVDIDVAESMRSHIQKLARRHEGVFERAMRKMEIDREY